MNSQQSKQKNQIVGSFGIIPYMVISSLAIQSSLLCAYFISVNLGQEPPYPFLSITGSAIHYPQAQIFRFGMGSCTGFFMLVFHVFFIWIKAQAKKFGYQGCTYQKMYWPTVLSVIGYSFCIGTVDSEGTRSTYYEEIMHGGGAIWFIIFLGFLMLFITIICGLIFKKNRAFMKSWSLALKLILAIYLIGFLFIYIPILIVWQNEEMKVEDRDQPLTYVNKAQWNFIFCCPLWLCSFLYDFKNVRITLKKGEVVQGKHKQPIKEIQGMEKSQNVLNSVDEKIESVRKIDDEQPSNDKKIQDFSLECQNYEIRQTRDEKGPSKVEIKNDHITLVQQIQCQDENEEIPENLGVKQIKNEVEMNPAHLESDCKTAY